MFLNKKLPSYERKSYARKLFIDLRLMMSNMSVNPENYPDLPKGFVVHENQVAGHTFVKEKKELGLIKCTEEGLLYKPASVKPILGTREINFYETVENATEKDIIQLKKLIPDYKGHAELCVNGEMVDFIKLSDIATQMCEPCIMDIKIGQRTWDPEATKEKREAEEKKYLACRKAYSLCVPGFQVYSLSDGNVYRYGRDYGKKLDEHTLKDAFRNFLNAGPGICKILLLKFLSDLWKIQEWARSQKRFRLYSSSVLLVYDASKLKFQFQRQKSLNSSNPKKSPSSPIDNIASPIFYQQIQRNHSNTNNYEQDMQNIRDNYTLMLGTIADIPGDSKDWVHAKMIDFAHVFPAEDQTVDDNYLQGIECLVKIFEGFLKECE